MAGYKSKTNGAALARIRDQDGTTRMENQVSLPLFRVSSALLLANAMRGGCVDPAVGRRGARKIRNGEINASREQDETKPRAIILIF